MSSYVSKIRFESQLPHIYCQIFSGGFNSGARERRKTGVIFKAVCETFLRISPEQPKSAFSTAQVERLPIADGAICKAIRLSAPSFKRKI